MPGTDVRHGTWAAMLFSVLFSAQFSVTKHMGGYQRAEEVRRRLKKALADREYTYGATLSAYARGKLCPVLK
eukprot:3169095-Rhodomonas_salina.1